MPSENKKIPDQLFELVGQGSNQELSTMLAVATNFQLNDTNFDKFMNVLTKGRVSISYRLNMNHQIHLQLIERFQYSNSSE